MPNHQVASVTGHRALLAALLRSTVECGWTEDTFAESPGKAHRLTNYC
jgi:hypothetical protein